MAQHRILLVDNDTSTRKGLRMLLSCDPELVIAGEAHNCADAVDSVELLSPDLVLLDPGSPGERAMACATELSRRFPDVPLVLLSLGDNAGYRALAAETGAVFIPWQALAEHLLSTIHNLLGSR